MSRLLDVLPLGVAHLDGDLAIVEANAQLARLLGRADEDLTGQPLASVLPAIAGDAAAVLANRVPAVRRAVGLRITLRPLPLAGTGAPGVALVAEGEISGAGAVVADHTALAQAEAAHRGSEQRLVQVVEQAPVSIAVFDREMRYVAVSRRFRADYRLGDQPLVGRAHYEVFPDLPQRLRDVHRRCLAGASDEGVEDVYRHPDGTEELVKRTMFPWYEAGGAIGGIVLMIELLTARRRAEAALAFEHRQLSTILATLHEGVLAFRGDGRLLWANPAALRVVQVDRVHGTPTVGEVAERRGLVPLDAHGRPLPEDAWPATRALRGESFTGLEMQVRNDPRGITHWFSHGGTAVRDEEGKVSLAVVSFTDITEHKRAEELVRTRTEQLSHANAALARALHLKDEFLAMMSHELRTPLNGVLGLTEAMREEVYGPITDRQRLALQRVHDAGSRLLGILADMLDLARIGAGDARLDRAAISVQALTSAALQRVTPAAQAKRIALQLGLGSGIDRLDGDERRLLQVLVNLLDNAVKFTPEGGTVTLSVTADRAREQIHFTVRDTGRGIAPEQQARLFQPFTQADGRLSRAHGGIGLGLALVRSLVDLHLGSVRMETTLGEGSTFTITLPWCLGEAPASVLCAAPPRAPWRSPPKLLIADDDEALLAAYADQLSTLGCAVTVARSGEEAVIQAHAARPDVMVLDLEMPGMEELAALHRLRADPTWAEVPILGLSALLMPGDRERCLGAGLTRYLPKPLVIHELVTAVAEALPAT